MHRQLTAVGLAIEVCLGGVALWANSPVLGVISAVGITLLGPKLFLAD